jgi:hypothetical protein
MPASHEGAGQRPIYGPNADGPNGGWVTPGTVVAVIVGLGGRVILKAYDNNPPPGQPQAHWRSRIDRSRLWSE